MLVWITGASSGIGRATALLLAKSGFQVALSARSKDKLEALKKEIPNAIVAPFDIRNEEDVIAAHQQIIQEAGTNVAILINNAGISPWNTFSQTSVEDFDAV